jgi:tricorn protease
MHLPCRVLLLLLAGWLLPALVLYADPDFHDTRLLEQPAVSAHNVAFIYADNLWVADLDGQHVRRLTSDVGTGSHPVFSPDGRTIAFSAQYDGNTDVYTIATEGGTPLRLTWHPDADTARGFTADGKAVLFSSGRNLFTNRYSQLISNATSIRNPTNKPLSSTNDSTAVATWRITISIIFAGRLSLCGPCATAAI